MMTQNMITPADILREREEWRKSLRIAHSANSRGELWARPGCPCYACRDQLDPTGEEDARQRNAESLPPPSHPATAPKLERQNATCICCETHHSSFAPCSNISLPPPPPAIRLPVSSLGPSSSVISPLIGVMSPRSLSDSSTVPEEKYLSMEKQILPRLKRLLASYEQAQLNLEERGKGSTLTHDEMAATDVQWNELDTKILLVENLLKAINE